MVRTDSGRTSISTCIRRDVLLHLDRSRGGPAGAAVLERIRESCPAARPYLDGAELEGPWLSAGPIRPGFRGVHRADAFFVGNAAGEAHPVIAEGISMALQSAAMLAGLLVRCSDRARSRQVREAIGRDLAAAWRRSFGPRLRAAAIVARWSMSPALTGLSTPVLRLLPSLLTVGARYSGKARRMAAASLVPQ
jgi:flavin-dependent dehydrogenase